MDSVVLKIEAGVGFITLNRPEKLNSFNRGMALLLQEVLDQCAGRPEIRALHLTGAGKGFCAGQDLAEIPESESPPMHALLEETYNPLVRKICGLPKPVVAAVNGVAAGAGANLALCCDIVLAAESASFIQSFSKIGLVPDCAGSFFLPRLVGSQKARALFLLGEKVSAAEAEKMGMIYKTLPDQDFAAGSRQTALTLAAMPTRGLGYIKQLLNASPDNSLESQLQLEGELQQKAAATRDFREGVAAFLEKRTPRFNGN